MTIHIGTRIFSVSCDLCELAFSTVPNLSLSKFRFHGRSLIIYLKFQTRQDVQDRKDQQEEMEQMVLLVLKDLQGHLVRPELRGPADTEVKRGIKVNQANKANRVKMAPGGQRDRKVSREYKESRVIKECRGSRVNKVFMVKMDQMGNQVIMVYLDPRDKKAKQVGYILIYVDT